jgi:hypothetical protein
LASLSFVLFVAITDLLSFGARTAVRSFLGVTFDSARQANARVLRHGEGDGREVPVAVEFPGKELASNRFSGESFTRWSSVNRIELPVPEPHGRVAHLPLDRAPL